MVKEGDQNLNVQNCGFHTKNKATYCFNSKKPIDGAISHQPLYLHDIIELDHRYLCFFKKVNYDSMRNIKIFNQSIVNFS